ncbi:MAG: hypothetical protein Q9227_007192 [Pyrenula ochraceoflavens]
MGTIQEYYFQQRFLKNDLKLRAFQLARRNMSTLNQESRSTKRYAQIIRLRSSSAAEYISLHQRVWPDVLSRIAASNIHDYSIFYDEHTGLLFASFKYTGDSFEADMDEMKEDKETQRWWAVTDGMQESLNEGGGGGMGSRGNGWWRELKEVFHAE